MVEAARRAAGKQNRGGLPNVLFVAAGVEALPAELCGVAELVTCHFPWGSLLRGLVAADPATMSAVTGVMRPGASLSVLLSAMERDRGAGVPPIDDRAVQVMAAAYRRHGLDVVEVRPATLADVAAAHSTWGKRLGAGVQRPAWLLRATLTAPPPSAPHLAAFRHSLPRPPELPAAVTGRAEPA
jgi:16S rRNA (adenine(1408)-N(1))-methyltransferase